MRHRKAMQIQVISDLVFGESSGLATIHGSAECRNQALANSRGELVAHGEAVGRSNPKLISPDGEVGGHVHSFQRDIQAAGFGEVVAGDYRFDTHARPACCRSTSGPL